MFNVLEKFPDEDGGGVLWSIVHGLEHIGLYEKELIDSLMRQPSMLGVVMIMRIENTGQTTIAGRRIENMYHELLSHPKLTDSVKALIA